jgi:FAD/FMN-containing dehydrogenase
MKKFNCIHYNEQEKTLDVGAGLIWRQVYDYMNRFPALGVVGGDPLVGVSGWLLGGGYSLLTNRFGLGIDNVVGFRVIVPSKGICTISHKENPEIFKALKVRSLYHDTRGGLYSFDWEGRRA